MERVWKSNERWKSGQVNLFQTETDSFCASNSIVDEIDSFPKNSGLRTKTYSFCTLLYIYRCYMTNERQGRSTYCAVHVPNMWKTTDIRGPFRVLHQTREVES